MPPRQWFAKVCLMGRKMETIEIIRSATVSLDGLRTYSFEKIPQGYIKIYSLFCENDVMALKNAKKINDSFNYIIVQG